jgi:hypothetical protein
VPEDDSTDVNKQDVGDIHSSMVVHDSEADLGRIVIADGLGLPLEHDQHLPVSVHLEGS